MYICIYIYVYNDMCIYIYIYVHMYISHRQANRGSKLVPFFPTQHQQVRKKCGAFSARPRFYHSAGAYYGVAQNPPQAWASIAD